MTKNSNSPSLENIIVEQGFLSKSEEIVFKKLFCSITGKEEGKVPVRLVPRLGLSRAKVYIALFGNKVPHFVKIDAFAEVQKEFDRAMAIPVREQFLDSDPLVCPVKEGELAGLVYRDKRSTGAEGFRMDQETGELEEKILSQNVLPNSIGEYLEKMYRMCYSLAPMKIEKRNKRLYNIYSDKEYDYLRKEAKGTRDVSREIIRQVIPEVKENKRQVIFHSRALFNPLYAVDNFFRKDTPCSMGPVHGDLHPRNIIINDRNLPCLIDFKWASPESHSMIDFVMLENSLRFFLAPKYFNFEEQLSFCDLLLSTDGWGKIQIPTATTEETRRYTALLFESIAVIRKYASQASKVKNFFDEYLASQFLVLYGLLKYKECETQTGIYTLCQLAKKLSETRFGEA